MIEYKVDNGDCHLRAVGDIAELGTDILMLVCRVYERIKNKDKDLADEFKRIFKNAIADDMPFLTAKEMEQVNKAQEEQRKARAIAEAKAEAKKHPCGKATVADVLGDDLIDKIIDKVFNRVKDEEEKEK